MLDGSSSTRSGSCISTHAVKPSLPVAIAAMMTPPDAGEEEASSRHGEKSKTKSNINLYISGYVNNPHKENEDTYGECFYVSSPYSSALPRASAGATSLTTTLVTSLLSLHARSKTPRCVRPIIV